MKRHLEECIAIASLFGNDMVLGKNRDRNYRPNLKVVRELTGYGVELCYVVDQDTDWTEGMNSRGILPPLILLTNSNPVFSLSS